MSFRVKRSSQISKHFCGFAGLEIESSDPMPIENISLPASTIQSIVKKPLPKTAQIQKSSRKTMGDATIVFIHYITHLAVSEMELKKKATLTPECIYAALAKTPYSSFIPYLKMFESIRKDPLISSLNQNETEIDDEEVAGQVTEQVTATTPIVPIVPSPQLIHNSLQDSQNEPIPSISQHSHNKSPISQSSSMAKYDFLENPDSYDDTEG